jgi:hypothetical protein
VGGVSAAVSKTAAAPIERVKLLIQNQVRAINQNPFIIIFFVDISVWICMGVLRKFIFSASVDCFDLQSDFITSAIIFTITATNSMGL